MFLLLCFEHSMNTFTGRRAKGDEMSCQSFKPFYDNILIKNTTLHALIKTMTQHKTVNNALY